MVWSHASISAGPLRGQACRTSLALIALVAGSYRASRRIPGCSSLHVVQWSSHQFQLTPDCLARTHVPATRSICHQLHIHLLPEINCWLRTLHYLLALPRRKAAHAGRAPRTPSQSFSSARRSTKFQLSWAPAFCSLSYRRGAISGLCTAWSELESKCFSFVPHSLTSCAGSSFEEEP